MHISSKDRVRWWLQQLKKDWNDYIIISKLKKLAILEKVIRDNSDKIEETDTYSTQKEDTAEINN